MGAALIPRTVTRWPYFKAFGGDRLGRGGVEHGDQVRDDGAHPIALTRHEMLILELAPPSAAPRMFPGRR